MVLIARRFLFDYSQGFAALATLGAVDVIHGSGHLLFTILLKGVLAQLLHVELLKLVRCSAVEVRVADRVRSVFVD